MPESEPFKASSMLRRISSQFLGVTLAFTVLILVVLLCLALWGPDPHQLDEMALQLQHQREMGIRQELMWQASLLWKELFLGPDAPEVAHALDNLADYYSCVRDYEKVEELLIRSIAIKERIYESGPLVSALKSEPYIDLVDSLSDLTSFYINGKRYHDAARVLTKEFKVLKSYKQQYSFQLLPYLRLYVIVARNVRPDELKEVKGAFNTDSVFNELAQGMNYFNARRDKSAVHTNEIATWHLQEFYKIASASYLMEKDLADAENTFSKSMVVASNSHPLFSTKDEDLLELAMMHQAKGDMSKAEGCYKTALSSGGCSTDGNPLTCYVALRDYASLLKDMGRESEANGLQSQSSDIKESLQLKVSGEHKEGSKRPVRSPR